MGSGMLSQPCPLASTCPLLLDSMELSHAHTSQVLGGYARPFQGSLLRHYAFPRLPDSLVGKRIFTDCLANTRAWQLMALM